MRKAKTKLVVRNITRRQQVTLLGRKHQSLTVAAWACITETLVDVDKRCFRPDGRRVLVVILYTVSTEGVRALVSARRFATRAAAHAYVLDREWPSPWEWLTQFGGVWKTDKEMEQLGAG